VRTNPRRFRALLSAALGLLVGALAPLAAVARALAARHHATTCRGAELHPSSADLAAVQAATVCLINQVRTSHGRRPLRDNGYLQRVAVGQVAQMVRWNYFADVRPSGQTPRALIGSSAYARHAARLRTGQNIGWATAGEATPRNMVRAWMHSAPHRAVILAGGFRDLGVAIAPSLPSRLRQGSGGALYAAEFAARRR
jgi:uncharacterized protein YkwD